MAPRNKTDYPLTHQATVTMTDVERATSALLSIDPGCGREEWVRIGMAAKAAGLSFDVFHDWCKPAANYVNEKDCLSAWKSFNEAGGITAASLFDKAIKEGWKAPAKASNKNTYASALKVVKPVQKPAITTESTKAIKVWELCEPAPHDHPYLTKKRGVPDGLRIYPHDAPVLRIMGQNVGGYLAVPCWADGMLQTIQFIPGEGKKLNLSDAQYGVGFFVVGDVAADARIHVVEGIGQAWAVYGTTGAAAAVCFGFSRMRTVAAQLRAQYPSSDIILVPDRAKEEQVATIAAAIGCKWCELPADLTVPANYDVNDYAQDYGTEALEVVLNALHGVHAAASPSASNIVTFPVPSFSKCDARDGTQNTRPLTEYGNALRLVDLHGDRLKYVHDARKWIIWNGSAWTWDDGAGVRASAVALAGQIYAEGSAHLDGAELFAKWARKSQENRTAIASVSMLADAQQMRMPMSCIDSDHFVVGLNHASMVIDLRNGAMRPAVPADYVTKSLGVETLGDAAKAVRWIQFLEQVFEGDQALIDWMQRFCGYLLTGSTREQIFLFCFGHGANGKSVFIEVLKYMLGDYSRAIAPETLCESKRQAGAATPDLVELIGARLAICSETEDNTALAESLVKTMVAGDSMTARPLYATQIPFTPHFKLVMAGNHKPIVRGNDNGLWRRVRLIPFNVTFAPEDRDPHLLDKLKAERMHILAWMVEGAIEWQQRSLADTPAAIMAATDAYQVDQDLMGRWLEECTRSAPGYETASGDLYESYKTWCIDNGLRPASNVALGRRLSERGYTVRQSHGKRFVVGLRLTEAARADSRSYSQVKGGY